MLSQEIAEDSKLARCSDEAALTYAFTIPFLDRDGLCSGKPSWIAGRALQERPHLQHKAVTYIGEWVTQGLVIRYDGSDGPVLFFPGFRKHNAHMPYEKEAPSKYPPPPGYHRDEDEKGVSHGLIPDDPEAAGRLAELFDGRSTYRKALTEAARNQVTLADSLGLNASSHNKVATKSRPTPDLLPTSSRLSSDEVATNNNRSRTTTEVEVEVEGNNNNALHELILKEAETAVVVVGASSLLQKLDHDQTMALLSWLWLYNGWYQDDLDDRDYFRRPYTGDPFAGMNSPGAVMVKLAREGKPAPLTKDDRAEMLDRLRALQEAAS